MNAFYSSKFDPITNAHMNIIKKINILFDKIIINIMDADNKDNFFTGEEQLKLIKELYKDEKKIRVILGSNNDIDALIMAKIQECDVIVRSLNGMSNYKYEEQIEKIANDMYKDSLSIIHLFVDNEFNFITSDTVKKMFNEYIDISKYVHPKINEAMKVKKKRIY